MVGPLNHTFDILQQVGRISGKISLASWIFVPENLSAMEMIPVLFCLPGGGYSKAYYHLPGHPGYSFAQHMAERGFVVVAIDHFGTGESTRPDNGQQVTSPLMAQANHQVVQQLRDLLSQGMIAGIKTEKLYIAGIGHSMGAMLGILQQSMYRSFDAIATLGWANGAMSIQVNEVQPRIDDHGYAWTDREKLAPFFYGTFGVPEEIIAADTALATCIPTGAFDFLSTPSAMQRSAAPISVPVFFANGSIDAAANLPDEARFYPHSSDITIFRLHGAGHVHNFAPTRKVLWDRLAWWIDTLMARSCFCRTSPIS
jgi:pimeloyl-ACP methyl ester carboxylesterase